MLKSMYNTALEKLDTELAYYQKVCSVQLHLGRIESAQKSAAKAAKLRSERNKLVIKYSGKLK